MNNQLIIVVGVIIVLLLIIFCIPKKENFVQGYDYTIADCIRRCEFDVNNKNNFYSLYEDDGYASESSCKDFCRSEYNKQQLIDSEQLLKHRLLGSQKYPTNYMDCASNEPMMFYKGTDDKLGTQARKTPLWAEPLKANNYFASNCNHSLFLK